MHFLEHLQITAASRAGQPALGQIPGHVSPSATAALLQWAVTRRSPDARHTRRCSGGAVEAQCDRSSPRSALLMLGRIAPITHPELSPPSARAVASYVTATASAVAVSAARTPNMPTTGSSRRAGKYPGPAITVYSNLPGRLPPRRSCWSRPPARPHPRRSAALRSRTLPRGEATARCGSGRPGSTHLAADLPTTRPPARHDDAVPGNRDLHTRGLLRDRAQRPGPNGHSSPRPCERAFADVSNVREIHS